MNALRTNAARLVLWLLPAVGLLCIGADGCMMTKLDSAPQDADVVYVGPSERDALFAKVVDESTLLVDSGCIEPEPYAYLLECARGERESALRKHCAEETTYEGLMTDPDRCRGDVMTAYGMVLEMKTDSAPEGFVPRGMIVRSGLIGTREGEYYAIRSLMSRSDPMPRIGQFVWFTGYFLKRLALTGNDGKVRFAPLLVGPAPTLTDKSLRPYVVAAAFNLNEIVPTSQYGSRSVSNRLVLDVSAGGVVSAGGRDLSPAELETVLADEAKRAFSSPGTSEWGVVVRRAKGAPGNVVDGLAARIKAQKVLAPVLKTKPE